MASITKYLLPCECGQKVPVELGQAGQTVQCDCGRSLQVPSMRGVKSLETVEVETEKRTEVRESNWNRNRGILFSIALLVAAVAFLFAGIQYRSMRMLGEPLTETVATEMIDETIDDYTPEQLFDLWSHYRDHGIGPHQMPDYVLHGKLVAQLRMVTIVFATIGACSLAVAIAAIAVKRSK